MLNAKSAVIANAIRIDNSIVACSVIARFLRDYLSCEAVDSADVALRAQRYDTLIMINSPWGFCSEEHRARVRQILWSARRVVWVQNDYNSGIGPRSFKSMGAWLDEGRALDLWTTIPDYVERGYVTKRIPLTERSTYVNWNALHYEHRQRRLDYAPGPRRLFYFGAYRPERAERFAKYLKPDLYPVTISTAVGRSVERFRELLGPNVTIESREANLLTRLTNEWATVYIEDRRANEMYVSPAARFYEALSAGCCQLIDADAVPNLERAGFTVDARWVVHDARDIKAALPYALTIAADQRAAWARTRITKQFHYQLTEALSK